MHYYLPQVYIDIVDPMSKNLRQLMLLFKLQTEASIFASDLRYKLCEEPKTSSFKNVEGYKPEESLIVLNNKLG